MVVLLTVRSTANFDSLLDLTGDYPAASPGTGALAGTTQELALKTAYYRAQVPIWLDVVGRTQTGEAKEAKTEEPKADEPKEANGTSKESTETTETAEAATDAPAVQPTSAPSPDDTDEADDPTTPKQWADAFLADEAQEVREALGGVVAVVEVHPASVASSSPSRQRELVEHVGRLVQGLGMVYDLGEEAKEEDEDDLEELREPWDGISVVVGVSQGPIDEDTFAAWDDACNAAGLEFVAVAPGQETLNEFGEKTGIPRLLEALEANDWELVGAGGGDDGEDGLFGSFQDVRFPGSDDDGEINFDDPESVDFGFDRDDFAGLRQAIWQQSTAETADNDDEEDKDQAAIMESMVRRLQAARLQSELLTPAQRRAMAARVVGEVMREI